MAILSLKPTQKKITAYYESLATFEKLGIAHETAVRSAFQMLLDECGRQFGWKLVPEYPIRRKGQKPLRADGALVDIYNLPHGLWDAKDTDDDLEKEIKAKLALGYPKDNLLFQSPSRAVLYQNGQRVFDDTIHKAEHLIDVLRLFLEFEPPAFAEWEKSVEEFKNRIAEYGQALRDILARERKTNKAYVLAFTDFLALCRASLNPNLSEDAVSEMLIQHILTERIFRKIFQAADFMQRNVIAVEIEKVIHALTSQSFTRDAFLKNLDRFYLAIEHAAATITDFSEKQKFLNINFFVRLPQKKAAKRKAKIFHHAETSSARAPGRMPGAAGGTPTLPETNPLALFHSFAAIGKKLIALHVHYENAKEHPLRQRENPDFPLSYRVERMRLSADKSELHYNDFLTLTGIPPETYAYRLGNRSALEWVIDQYQMSTDTRSGLENDPNNLDDERSILRLIGQVITVSLQTQKLIANLPAMDCA